MTLAHPVVARWAAVVLFLLVPATGLAQSDAGATTDTGPAAEASAPSAAMGPTESSPPAADVRAADLPAQRIHALEDAVLALQREQESTRATRELKDKKQALPPINPPVTSGLPVKLGASVTLRYDRSTTEDQTDLYLEDDTFIHGLRTRVRFSAELSDPKSILAAGIRLSTGENPNPTVPFIALGDAFRSHSFGLDQAYFSLRPFENRSVLSATFGKMPNPFWRGRRGPFRSELVWDDDVNPEGVALKAQLFRHGEGESAISIENVAGYFLMTDIPTLRFTGITGPAYLIADQLRAELPFFAAAVSYYAFENINTGLSTPSNVAGQAASLTPATNAFLLRPGLQTTNNRVNYGPGADGFVHDEFRVLSITGQAHLPLRVIEHGGDQEIFVLGDYARNGSTRLNRNGFGATLGVRLGGYDDAVLHPANMWLTYRDVGADASLATLADSDLGGGTAYKGFEWAGSYRILKNFMAQFSYFTYEGYPRQDNRIHRLFVDLVVDY